MEEDEEIESAPEATDKTAAGWPEEITLEAYSQNSGERIDRFLSTVLAARLDGISRTRVQTLIRQGNVRGLSGTIGDPGFRVKPGDTFTVTLPPPEPAEPSGQDIPLAIVYEDQELIVIDKPAGLVVHPAAGHADGTLVNALIAHCGESLSGIGGVKRPGIVHRLDRDTSGLLVVAKTDRVHQGLAEQFASHGEDGRLERAYIAIVWGVPPARVGTIDARIGRSPTNRTRMAVIRREAASRRAVTHYELLETFSGDNGEPLASRLRLVLETGRTHQIRVHLAHIGHPVMGDPVYAAGFKASNKKLSSRAQDALEELSRQALHAAELGFEHPLTGEDLHFESPIPGDIAALEAALRPAPISRKKPSATRTAAKRAPAPAKGKIAKP
ncbi:MAG: RluA family pseudouridine synthase [Hyphomicrobium sp.]|jgi:23S rRNA pseudouridine1911/1915/1917 synthase